MDVNQGNEFMATPLTVCLNAKNLDVLTELGKRPDLQVREEDRQLAKSLGIDLNSYIKPDDSMLEDMESLLSELESAASVAAG